MKLLKAFTNNRRDGELEEDSLPDRDYWTAKKESIL